MASDDPVAFIEYDAKRMARMLRWFEQTAIGRPRDGFGGASDYLPPRLAKPRSGQTLDGSTPGTSALCDIYGGVPGSIAVTESSVRVYPGEAMGSSNSIDDTTYFWCAAVDGYYRFLSPIVGTGGSSTAGGMIVVELPSDLAKTDATKASCTVKATFSGGPSVASTVTITNPPAKGGNYQFRATSTTQYVNATWQGGSTYLIVSVQPVAFDPVDDVTWDGTDLEQVKRDIDIGFSGSTATTTIDSATDCAL